MKKETYDVLRFVEHGETCHIASDNVTGQSLLNVLKYHPHVERKVILQWIKSLGEQIKLFHKGQRKAYYYVTPFSVIVTEEGVCLADLESRGNRTIRQKLERKTIKEMFYPEDTKGADMKGDFYSLGKTIQYIESAATEASNFNGKEKRYLKKLKQELLHEPQNNFKRLILLVAGILCVLSLIGVILSIQGRNDKKVEASNKIQPNQQEKETQENETQENEDSALRFHMGMLYLNEIEDYKKANEIFVNIFQNRKVAAHFADIAAYLEGKYKADDKQMLQCLLDAEKEYPKEEEISPIPSFVRVYMLLDTEAGYENVLRILNEHTEAVKNNIELKYAQAKAFEALEQWEDATKVYEELLEAEEKEEEKRDDTEAIYMRLADNYKNMEDLNKVYKSLRKGIAVCSDSIELRLLHLNVLCMDEAVENEKIQQTIIKYKEELPGILESEEFKKTQQQYNIKIEGGEVWVER